MTKLHTDNVCRCCPRSGPKTFTIEGIEGVHPWPGEGRKLDKVVQKIVGDFHQVCRHDGQHTYIIEEARR